MAKAKLLAIVSVMWFSTNSLADHPTVAFGNESAGPINTISAVPLAIGQWSYGIRSELVRLSAYSDAELEGFADNGKEGVHSVDMLLNSSVAIAYGLSENLSISARIPYVMRRNIREGELDLGVAEAHSHGNSSGIGDAVVFGQYRFFDNNTTSAAFLFGIKAPTGTTNVTDNSGARMEVEFQPGTGSWDALLGFSVSRESIGDFTYHANILSHITSEGVLETEIGNVTFYNAAVSYRVPRSKHEHEAANTDVVDHNHRRWDLLLELNAESRSASKISGLEQLHTGGDILYLSPGIKLSSETGWGGFLLVGVPVQTSLDGEQNDVDARLTAGFYSVF